MKMKHFTWKRSIALAMSGAMLLGLLSGCGGGGGSTGGDNGGGTAAGGDDGKVYELTLSIHDASEAPKTKALQKLADDVDAATDGRVKITVFSGGTLASATDALDAVKNGTADIACCYSTFFTGQFPLSEVVSLPMLGLESSVQATNVLWDLYDETPALQDEYSQFKVLGLWTSPVDYICTKGTAVRTADDLKGLKVRVTSGTPADMVTAWGGVGMTLSSSELYQSLEKGVIDGYIIDLTGVNSWTLYEVTDYYTEMPFFVGPWMLLMNQESWNQLPADLQEIVDGLIGRDYSLYNAGVYDDEAAQAKETAINEYGSEFIDVEGADLETFQKAADEYNAQWAGNHNADGFDAQAYLDRTIELAGQYAE